MYLAIQEDQQQNARCLTYWEIHGSEYGKDDNVKCLHVALAYRISELVGELVIALTFCLPKGKVRMIFP